MSYTVQYKLFCLPFYKKLKVSGHFYAVETDRMDFFLAKDQGILSIGKWSLYEMKLSADFIEFQKKTAEQEAGRSIPFKQNNG